jgi:hypothetical protein
MLTGLCIARGCGRAWTSRVSGWFHPRATLDGLGVGLDFSVGSGGILADRGTALVCPGHEQELAVAGRIACTGDARVLFPERP